MTKGQESSRWAERAGTEDGAELLPAFGGGWCCEQKLCVLIGLGSFTSTTA